MNEIKAANESNAARKRIPRIVQAIDEITFQASILRLNAAVEAAGGQRSQTQERAQTATETLALIEESIIRSAVFGAVKRTGVAPEPATGTDEIARMADELHRIKRAAPAAATKHSFREPR